jgi:hypothetical protein
MTDFNPFDCLRWAADHHCDGHGPAKLVLMILAGYAGWDSAAGEWTCYPSQEAIGERALQTTRSVRRNLKLLEDSGAITRRPHWGGGHRKTDRYVLHVIPDKLSGKADSYRTPVAPIPDTSGTHTGHSSSFIPDTSVQGTTSELPEELPERTTSTNGDPFDAFWSIYPRKSAKKDARKAWDKLTVTERSFAITGAETYRDDPNRDPGYTKHPATWLNAGCWEDDPLPSRTNSNNTRTHQPIEEWWDRSEPSGELDL